MACVSNVYKFLKVDQVSESWDEMVETICAFDPGQISQRNVIRGGALSRTFTHYMNTDDEHYSCLRYGG